MSVKSVCAALTGWPGVDSSETTETVFLSVLEVGEIKVSASGMPAEDWLSGSQITALHCVLMW